MINNKDIFRQSRHLVTHAAAFDEKIVQIASADLSFSELNKKCSFSLHFLF